MSPTDPLRDFCRSWSLADLLADPSVLYRVPTRRLEYLHTQTLYAVMPAEMHDGARERLQTLRTMIAQTLNRRLQLDQEQRQDATMPQDAPEPPEVSDTPQTTAEQACKLLAAALMLIQGSDNGNGNGNGGTRQPVSPRPTRPTPPSQARQPNDVGF